ncbi:hypothetical protein QBC32DRAFT_313405 [Pseudoneurospora amorphoporcata]|uniref:Uncharacterized protein n=1 Tax=Pseudoneurospora amorphoporcata TaxID=241081 RepID=A0AAN6SG32_9PEZI|nr:hypothetical protein QBC32DRAFT_313405 [Pseudoneurospora amorphoporcata]
MQQLPCGCRRVGRRTCIEPNCLNEAVESKNDLYFCPIARERNLRHTGEPELCPVELPANTWTQIKHTGRCARHKKEMVEKLQREMKRKQKEEERRKELEKEKEMKEKEEERERMRGGNRGTGTGTGLGLIREGVVERGNGSGMDVDEFKHVNKVLEARDRARAAGGVDVEVGVESMSESGLEMGMGPMSEGLRRMAVEEERKKEGEKEKAIRMEWEKRVMEQEMAKADKERKEKEERRKEKEKQKREEEEEQLRRLSMTKEERMEYAKKRYTGIEATGKVQTATEMLQDIVAKDWEEEARLGGPRDG